jgi:hypothetical protein
MTNFGMDLSFDELHGHPPRATVALASALVSARMGSVPDVMSLVLNCV